MAYSRSEETLRGMLVHLNALAHGRAQKWSVGEGRAWWWAAKVREALYIAREVFPHKYPELARAARAFTIEVLDGQTVQARQSSNTPATAISNGEGLVETETAKRPDTTPIHGLEPATSVPRTIVGQHSVTDIIAFCLRAMPTNDKLVFTETNLTYAEMGQLASWADSRTPRWMVVHSPSNPGIVTLCPFQPGIPSWSPKTPTGAAL